MNLRRQPPSEPPLVLGHRGASALETENTLAAFRRARADGADGVELDARLAATGEVVVFHDDDLRRLAGQPDRVADLPLAALRRARLPRGETIPTLDEVLEELGPALLVNVELKVPAFGLGPRVAWSVAGVIARHDAADRVLVSSFHPGALAAFRLAAPAVATGLLFAAAQALPLRRACLRRLLGPRALHPELALVSERRVRRWHREGRAVLVWTVNDPADARRMTALGVDGIITDDPGRARSSTGRPGPRR